MPPRRGPTNGSQNRRREITSIHTAAPTMPLRPDALMVAPFHSAA
jgi:hypothetical protein